jgi:hypothetical protein
LEANLSNIRVEIVPGARHVAPLQNTAAFVQLVQKYSRALSRAWQEGNATSERREVPVFPGGSRRQAQAKASDRKND